MPGNVYKRSWFPAIWASLTFLAVGMVTFFIVYQRNLIAKEERSIALQTELHNVRDQLRTVMNDNIASANALAVIYKHYGYINDFDTICSELKKLNPNIDFLEFTEGFRIVDIYPGRGNEIAQGKSILDYANLKKEALYALSHKHMQYAGPYHMLAGPMAIAGRVSIFNGGRFVGFTIVVTKLETIERMLRHNEFNENKFDYQLTKRSVTTGKPEHFFSDANFQKSESRSIFMPEGNWVLSVAFVSAYQYDDKLYSIMVLGILLSCCVASIVYISTRRKEQLRYLVSVRTHSLAERVKELSAIHQISELLKDEKQSIDELMTRIVNMLPDGWQHVDECQARIVFDSKAYLSTGFGTLVSSQNVDFKLADGRLGTIEVSYRKDMPGEYEGPFLQEERNLINTIADSLTVYLNKVQHRRELAQSEERFRSAFEHAAIGMALVSLDGKWLVVNDELCNITGYSKEELLQMTFPEVTHPDDVSSDLDAIRHLINGSLNFYRKNKRYVHKSGQTVWVNINVAIVRDESGQPLYTVAEIENISERIESEMKFKNLVEGSLVGVYIVQHGKLVYVNPRIVQYYGYDELQLYGYNIDHFVYKEDRVLMRNNIAARFEGKTNEIRYEMRVLCKDGEISWVEIFGSNTVYQGKPAIIGTIIDVTERKRLELEREKIIQELTQKNRDLEQFSHILSHNMRAPISTMLGLIDIYRTPVEDEDKAIAFNGIEQSVHNLEIVIRDLNEILRVKHSISEVKSHIRLADKLKKATSMLEGLISDKNAIIESDFSRAEHIYSVRAYLTSVFYNLLSNSLKYSHAERRPHIVISSKIEKEMLVLSFKDNGIGINLEQHRANLFGLYQRFNFSVGGKGLGLFMIKTAVESMQGVIEISSTPNVGTEVFVKLPLDADRVKYNVI